MVAEPAAARGRDSEGFESASRETASREAIRPGLHRVVAAGRLRRQRARRNTLPSLLFVRGFWLPLLRLSRESCPPRLVGRPPTWSRARVCDADSEGGSVRKAWLARGDAQNSSSNQAHGRSGR